MIQARRRAMGKGRHFVALGLVIFLVISGCFSFRLPALGLAGKYRQGKELLLKPRGIGAAEAVPHLEAIARQDPTYRDTLTLLGKAYYKQGAYQEALQMLLRAVAVNREDEIAWIYLGLSELRLDIDQEGFEHLKGGVALLNKVSKAGYRGYPRWDINGLVRAAIRRVVFLIAKEGLNKKSDLIRVSERMLEQMDDEELSLLKEERITRQPDP